MHQHVMVLHGKVFISHCGEAEVEAARAMLRKAEDMVQQMQVQQTMDRMAGDKANHTAIDAVIAQFKVLQGRLATLQQ